MAKVKATCLSQKKGRKSEVPEIYLEAGLGAAGDFHAQGGERQVSLLNEESIEKMRQKGFKLGHGAFGENIITQGLNLSSLQIGQIIKIGEAEVCTSRIGKECLERCAIYYQTGDCIMPREGIFARVVKSGKVKPGDLVEVIK